MLNKVHLVQIRLTDPQYEKFVKLAKKEGFNHAATLAKQLILNYMLGFNKK